MEQKLKNLIKLSIERAEKEFPNGFNKIQLIEISETIKKELKNSDPILFGKIETENDIVSQRNNMIDGNYPASISDCEVVGINGDCGKECPVFMRGDCENAEEVLKN